MHKRTHLRSQGLHTLLVLAFGLQLVCGQVRAQPAQLPVAGLLHIVVLVLKVLHARACVCVCVCPYEWACVCTLCMSVPVYVYVRTHALFCVRMGSLFPLYRACIVVERLSAAAPEILTSPAPHRLFV